mgnify:CR=1 FL=1
MSAVLRLITIGFSHFCEKARWALDRTALEYSEDDHVPLFHWRASFGAGGTRTVPVLVTPGRVLKDSKLVRFRREGKTVFYALDDDHVRSILSMGMDHIEE